MSGFYNRGIFLERTINSILAQSLDDFELIIFDDCSPDDTSARLADIFQKLDDDRFRYIVHDTNKGFVLGLRDAIEASSGDYIAIQGSGDASLPRRLELQARLLDERPDVAVVGGWYYNVQEDLGTRRLRKPDADNMTFSDLLTENAFSHGEVMIRRTAYDEVGGYRTAFKYAQDRDLWLRMARTWSLATVPEPLYERYVQFDGVSYVPSKIVSQSCYSTSAVRMAQMDAEDEAAALRRIETEGPAEVVPASDPQVQRKIAQAVIRMTMFGSPDSGIELARSYVTNGLVRGGLVAFGRVYRSRLFSPFRPLAQRAVGMT